MTDTPVNNEPVNPALAALNDDKPMFSDKTYDRVKALVTLGLPAFGALYFALAGYWDWPSGEQVVGTCAVLATFFGVLLNIAGRSYEKSDDMYDGVIAVKTDPESGVKQAAIALKAYENPADVVTQSEARFKVVGS